MSNRIYLDNAATTPILEEVRAEMAYWLEHGFGNPSSIYAEGRAAKTAIEQSRKMVAKAINASIGSIFFTSGGTESSNMAIKGAVQDLEIKNIISTKIEHHCVLHCIRNLEQRGAITVKWLGVDQDGSISLEELENHLASAKDKTLVSIMHANNEIGTKFNLKMIGKICSEYNALFHSDTVQTIGHFPIDVQTTNIHFLTGSAHKFHGPKGVGFIYIDPEVTLNPFIDGGSQERNMRGGTENVSGIVGLAKALELAIDEMDERREKILNLKTYLKDSLVGIIPEIKFLGKSDPDCLYTVLSVSFPPHPSNEMLLFKLDIAGISASGGSACSSGAESQSHVLAAIQAESDRKVIRFSFSHLNTKIELDRVIQLIKEIY